MADQLNLLKPLKVSVFKSVQNIVISLHKPGLNDQLVYRHLCSKHLSVIAYHQPVTRADIEQIRGVTNNSQILRTLFDWNWIKESGFRELPGRPALLVTTPQFLNAFGLTTLGQLPPLQDAKEAFMALDANAPKS